MNGRTLVVRPLSGPPSIETGSGSSTTTPAERVNPSRAHPAERGGAPASTRPRHEARTGTAYQTTRDGDSATFGSKADQLSKEEKAQLEELKARDREVRTHEEAHKAAAGSLFRGGPHYGYTTGPDGAKYATSGRVQIDTSEAETPEKTIAKAAQIRRAALAPADPSSTDRAVAAKASAMESKARREMAEQRSEQTEEASAVAAFESPAPSLSGPGEAGKTEAPDRIQAESGKTKPWSPAGANGGGGSSPVATLRSSLLDVIG